MTITNGSNVNKNVWFSVRCIFRFEIADLVHTYEERITIWLASTADEAIEMAEAEALSYAIDVECVYCGLAQLYCLSDALENGAEVFSLMRNSDLNTNDYLNTFFDTGSERQLEISQ